MLVLNSNDMELVSISTEDGEQITRINVMRVFTYDVKEIIKQMNEGLCDDDSYEKIEFEDIIDRVHLMASEDFAHISGNEIRDLIIQDEHGNDY